MTKPPLALSFSLWTHEIRIVFLLRFLSESSSARAP